MSQPLLSILTPTFHAYPYLQRAIRSVQAQDCPAWELLICPDDGADYKHLERLDERIRVIPSYDSPGTGAGAARNRGLAVARGECIAVLDDDDELEPNFVRAVLDQFRTEDLFTVPTCYVDEAGELVRLIGVDSPVLSIEAFARMYGSLHVIGRRSTYIEYPDGFAQDVLHTCAVIDLAGGHLPVLRDTTYICHLRKNSVCAVHQDIDAQYKRLAQCRYSWMSERDAAATRALFERRQVANQWFEIYGAAGHGYHDFIRDVVLG
ncbi:glycosyltransferase family 2 protein [Burkholderia multivorans]|uniref:glycosyltransferase family 2 protein n=1 Tax=Burkholderia multivorans TaxID=87883 RepID=UPI001C21D831|nr:glycosyltransferase family 2 protein [Burkholderia multivorans]MDN8078904.1 glycosyltransferase family A protein [Burkholderia multivorans]